MALKNVSSFSKEHNYGEFKGIGTEEFMWFFAVNKATKECEQNILSFKKFSFPSTHCVSNG